MGLVLIIVSSTYIFLQCSGHKDFTKRDMAVLDTMNLNVLFILMLLVTNLANAKNLQNDLNFAHGNSSERTQ